MIAPHGFRGRTPLRTAVSVEAHRRHAAVGAEDRAHRSEQAEEALPRLLAAAAPGLR
ncbi:hypothetical protein [Streptomyces omiyaensis]|uniref:Uncharacterized protein n=1 Tax=Streptomyces omiyaensis TaxID=68247 RepID=A0ABW7BQE2_9ACTN